MPVPFYMSLVPRQTCCLTAWRLEGSKWKLGFWLLASMLYHYAVYVRSLDAIHTSQVLASRPQYCRHWNIMESGAQYEAH